MKIRPVGAELFHADGRTDRQDEAKLVVVFRNFAKAPKNIIGPRALFRTPPPPPRSRGH
jgi:hypothetical protein